MKHRLSIAAVTLVVIAAGCFGWRAWSRRNFLNTRIAERVTYDAPATGAFAAAEDWPRWRGPRGDGISRETLPDALPAAGPKRLWVADVGVGYSSPVAAGGRVYVFTLDNGNEALTAFDARSGHIAWSDESSAGWTGDYAGTRASPVIDGDAVFTYGGGGDLVCHDLAGGKPRWRVNVLDATGSKGLQWGAASTPLVANGLVYVQGGSGGAVAAAFRREDGKVAWRSEARGAGGYAQIVQADVAGTPQPAQLIVFGGDTLFGMDPMTGRTLWGVPWKTEFGVNAATPVYQDGHLFVTSDYGMGCMMLQLGPGGARKLWEKKEVKSKFQPVILDAGFLYANSEGTLKCLSWPDGGLKWKSERGEPPLGEHGSLVRSGDKLLAQSDDGEISLLRATPEGMKILGQFQAVEGDKVWATPLLYGGRLYVKGPKELVCYDLGPSTVAQAQ